jgi:hypothetical protein
MKELILSLFLIVLFSGCIDQNKPIACTEEAKICPDGSAVGRVPPDCEFAPCPSTCICPEGYIADVNVCNPKCYYSVPKCLMPSISCINCSSYSVENCPIQCVVCPPCIQCSSISCQTEEFCKSIGFDREWYRNVS